MHLNLHEKVNLILSFINVYFLVSLILSSRGIFFLFSFSLLGQVSAQSTPKSALETAPSL